MALSIPVVLQMEEISKAVENDPELGELYRSYRMEQTNNLSSCWSEAGSYARASS